MKLIVGLGNPGKEYENTRHNLGYMAIDKLAKMLDIKISKEQMQGKIGIGKFGREKIFLVKPLTYMNLSGNCVGRVMHFYKIKPEDMIVLYDDIDINVGKIRVKPSGKPGTHNGMKDITAKIGTQEFNRVRIGSGKPEHEQDLAEYVLSQFRKEEMEDIERTTTEAAEAVVEILKNGIQSAMNKYN